jgi:hypothetical protein
VDAELGPGMSKYAHMTSDEIYSHIDKFGTDDEREIVEALVDYDPNPEPDWGDCPNCDDLAHELDRAKGKIEEIKIIVT